MRALWLQLGKLLQNSWYQSERTLVMAGNSSPSIQYTPLHNGTVLTSLHSVNFASAPLLDETLFATGAPSQNSRPW